ncbi:MED6 mediator sub complex component-domain-containing protein [Geopyxis carbonaria]|nr:MED6 mediator sub complex component-domain-containing protein [Geopyxis carbonaria]
MAGIQRPRTPQDETLWRNPTWYRTYGPLHENNVMQYFHDSPFFDPVSSNGDLMSQIEHNVQIRMKITSQQEFDNHLKKMKGLEFVVASGSTETGVWIVRKQERKSPTLANVLATYYVAGENIYQAPTIGAVLENRMMTIMADLQHVLNLTNSTSELNLSPAVAPTTSTTTAPAATPATIAPSTGAPQKWAPALLNRTLNLTNQHKGEYMDDHGPLLGDPGSLLSASNPQTQSQGQSQRSQDPSRSGTATPGMRGSIAPESSRGNFRK